LGGSTRLAYDPRPWTDVDRYFADRLLPPDAVLDAALEAADAAGLPAPGVAPNQGKLLHLLARIHCARKILELGTLAGDGTIWLASALPADGSLTTIEAVPAHAAVAWENIHRAGLSDIVDLRVGRAIDILPQQALLQGSSRLRVRPGSSNVWPKGGAMPSSDRAASRPTTGPG
jgi:predicted O-methyltransferase YrrM